MTTADKKPPSHREIKKGLKELKRQGRWDVRRSLDGMETPEERLEKATAELRNEKAYDNAQGCTECDATKKELNDVTALCTLHLEEALGL